MTRTERMVFYRALLRTVEQIPGVSSAGVITELFSLAAPEGLMTAEGRPPTPRGQAIKNSEVSAALLQTLGVALRSGRPFTEFDNLNSPGDPASAVINETMARRLWADEEAVGKRIKWGGAGVASALDHSHCRNGGRPSARARAPPGGGDVRRQQLPFGCRHGLGRPLRP